MAIQIVSEQRPYRLISDGSNHYAVLETRCGHVYPIHCHNHHPREGAPDTVDGMVRVARDQWEDALNARSSYQYLVENEEHYAQMLW